MFLADHSAILTFYTITPMHAGSGSATGAVDLPIQRERHTGRPMVQSSGVKGALRDAVEQNVLANLKETHNGVKEEILKKTEEIRAIFGSEETNDAQAGALSISDAKLLLFPVRSSHAPFLYVTCPSILRQWNKDLAIVGMKTLDGLATISINSEEGVVFDEELADRASGTKGVILEDMKVAVRKPSENVKKLKDYLNFFIKSYGTDILRKTVLLRDDDFNYLIESTCPVQTRIKLGPAGTTSESGGNLWYQELLPNDTLMYAVVFLSAERKLDNALPASCLHPWLKGKLPDHIQMGGDASLGRGFCELQWHDKKENCS